MTLEDLLTQMGQHQYVLIGAFAALPLVSFCLRFMHGSYRGAYAPWKYVYSVIVYASCLPGIFSVILAGYAFLFLRMNLLTLDMLVYFLPIVSMIVTLLAVRKAVEYKYIPGFNRLSGLVLMLGVSFFVAFMLDRFRLIVLFRGSLFSLLVIAAIAFVLLRLGSRLLFRKGIR